MADDIQIKGLGSDDGSQTQSTATQAGSISQAQIATSTGLQANSSQTSGASPMGGQIQITSSGNGSQAMISTGSQVVSPATLTGSGQQIVSPATLAGSSQQGAIQSDDIQIGGLTSDASQQQPIQANPQAEIATNSAVQSSSQDQDSQSAPKKKSFDLTAELEEEATPAPPEKYAIPTIVKEKFPDLVDLIKTTESMGDDERDYWFQILPIMTEEQISKFRDILVNEKEQLAKLDNEYEEELNRLNEKHMIEWKEFESKEKRRALTEAEAQAESAEKNTEEDLLAKLNQI